MIVLIMNKNCWMAYYELADGPTWDIISAFSAEEGPRRAEGGGLRVVFFRALLLGGGERESEEPEWDC